MALFGLIYCIVMLLFCCRGLESMIRYAYLMCYCFTRFVFSRISVIELWWTVYLSVNFRFLQVNNQ